MTRESPGNFARLECEVIGCARCPRLRDHCTRVARERRRAYADWEYWGKPVPGFGDPQAGVWIIGLAPGAHGANRTGRMFTGDRSGDFLFAALHRAGFANQAVSISRDDGLVLRDCYISASARCAPPGNRPTATEIANCSPFLDREWQMLNRKRAILALGRIGWEAALALARRHGCAFERRPFAHGAKLELRPELELIGSYHVSQQNTFTGRLTPAMFDEILSQCRAMICAPIAM